MLSIRRFVALGALLLGSSHARSGSAEEPTPGAPSEHTATEADSEASGADSRPSDRITPPEPLNTPVLPVDGSRDRVEIILELVIDREGHVTSARATGGPEPESTLATEATKAWTFRPATKGGVPVAAKIAYLVTFEPERVQGPLAPSPASTVEASAPALPRTVRAAHATAVPLAEVVILGDLPDPGVRTWTRADSRKLAGSFDDPLRSLEVLPGVTPILTGLPLFFVRGAPPGNVGFFLDGMRIPQLYHGFLGPSVLHPAFLAKVDLHAGPMPARYGRYAGAAVDAHLAEPHGAPRAEAHVRLFDAGGFAEMPFADGRGYVMAGARYSYTALILSAFAPSQRVDYWDYQAMVGYRLGKHDEVRAFAFGSFDYVGAGNITGGVEFHRADLNWTHHFGRRARMTLAATAGSDRTRSDFGFVKDNVLQGRFNYMLSGEQAILRVGGDVAIDDYETEIDPTITEPERYLDLFPSRTDAAGGAYVDVVLFPRGRVRVIPGVRADVYSSYGDTMAAVDVRLAAEYELTEWLVSRHAVGTAHQGPTFVPNVPGAQVGGLRGQLQESIQASSTFDFILPWEVTLSLGGFANVTTGLSDPIGSSQTLSFDETSADTRSLGRAVGFETFLKRPLTRRLGGLLSYTFSTTLRSDERIATVAGYDRPHVLNAALTYDLGRHWQASAKGAFASGIPGRVTTLDGYVFSGPRSAPLVRLDLKLAKRWYVSEHFNWGLNVEVLNATYAGTVSRRTCGRRGCEDEGTAPILIPSVGVDAAWN